MSSLSELVRLVGTLSEQIDRSREKSQAVALQMKQTKAIADDIGARWVADATTVLRSHLGAVDRLLVQANLGADEIRRGVESLRTDDQVQLPAVDQQADIVPGQALSQFVHGPWQRDRRWRRAMTLLPFAAPTTWAAGRFISAPRLVPGVVGAGLLAVAGVRVWDQERVRRGRLAWRVGARPQWQPDQSVDEEAQLLALWALQPGVSDWRETVERLQALDREKLTQVLDFVLAIDALALFISYEQQWPDKARTWQIASHFITARPGSGVDAGAVNRTLTALVDRRSAAELSDAAELLTSALALGTWLLAETPLPKGMRSEDFLHEIELALATRV